MNSLNLNKDFKARLNDNKTEAINKLNDIFGFANKLGDMYPNIRRRNRGDFSGQYFEKINENTDLNIKELITKLHDLETLIDANVDLNYSSEFFTTIIYCNNGHYELSLGHNNIPPKDEIFENNIGNMYLEEDDIDSTITDPLINYRLDHAFLNTGDFAAQFIDKIINY